MNLELPRREIAIATVFFAVSLAALGLMLAKLGTIPTPGAHTRTARAVFADAEGLPVQADVLVHGVKVGAVSGISVRAAGRTLVTMSLDAGAPALHPDASARVGFKTPLGEPFVDLDPGTGRGRLAGMVAARSTVEIDDALSFLDAGGRADARAALLQLGRGAAAPATTQAIGPTLAHHDGVTTEVGRLASELAAQRGDLSALISNGRVALDVLAGRAGSVRGLVGDAQQTLSAVASEHAALGGVLARLPGLLARASSTLTASRPLIAQANPVVANVTAAAPALTEALQALPQTTAAANTVLAQTPAIEREVLPALTLLHRLAGPGQTALSLLGPALADIVPVAQYLAPRGRTIAAWFSNTADLGSHGDAKGDWARFFVLFDPSTLTGSRSGPPPGNSYTAPGDAADNQPYRPGGYQRLMPYSPALAGSGR
jgi:phospholipid/cholesterol/gamma-HCH transport system substrate-binding protein